MMSFRPTAANHRGLALIRRRRIACTAAVVIVCLAAMADARSASAQLLPRRGTGRPNRQLTPASRQPMRPTVSPYLNLVSGNGSVTSNYFLRVRPEEQLRQAITTQEQQVQNLQKSVSNLQSQPAPTALSQLRPTGHTATFLNMGSYFPGQQRATPRR